MKAKLETLYDAPRNACVLTLDRHELYLIKLALGDLAVSTKMGSHWKTEAAKLLAEMPDENVVDALEKKS